MWRGLQVKRYSESFWSLGPHRLSNWETVKNQIEKGESKIQKRQEFMNAVKRKVEKYSNPWQQLKFQYGNAKGKVGCQLLSSDHDRLN
jgi:SWI/SNF-related matrix-associated actin-dependent regulator of chromatin subfamily A member 5